MLLLMHTISILDITLLETALYDVQFLVIADEVKSYGYTKRKDQQYPHALAFPRCRCPRSGITPKLTLDVQGLY